MLDLVERQVELVRVALGAAELAAVVGEHRPHRQIQVAVERQDLVVQHGHRRLRLLGDVQEAEAVAAVGVDHRVQVDPPDALERADHEGVGREQLARRPALDVALAKARIELLEEGDLLGREFDRLPRGLGLQGQPALLAGAELALVQKLMDGDRRHPPAFQSKHGLQPVAAVRRVLERQLQEPRHHLDRRGHRMALRHRRQVLEAIQTLQLEAALPVVEAGPVDAAAAARLADVAEPLGQLQNRHPAMRQLLMRILRRDPLRCRLSQSLTSSTSSLDHPKPQDKEG